MVRRHARSDRSFHYGPAVHVISGNYVAAKRRGVVGGVDYQHTGVVRFVQVDAIRRQLDSGNVVLLSNLGYSAAGEVLNCDAYTVACRAAIDLEADKLLCMTLPSTCPMATLPQWLPLSDAERMLLRMTAPTHLRSLDSALETAEGSSNGSSNGAAAVLGSNGVEGSARRTKASAESSEDLYDVAKWATYGLPPPLMAAVVACRNGVKRAHLVGGAVRCVRCAWCRTHPLYTSTPCTPPSTGRHAAGRRVAAGAVLARRRGLHGERRLLRGYPTSGGG